MRDKSSPELNRVAASDRPIHDWYRFVLSYPPHLVREYLAKFAPQGGAVLDPFAGTGTTLVEAKLHDLDGIGIEANPLAHFASSVKLDWSPQPERLLKYGRRIAEATEALLQRDGVPDSREQPLFDKPSKSTRTTLRTFAPEATRLLLANSISPLPLHKTLVLRDAIKSSAPEDLRSHLLLALAKSTVFFASNLHFGPEVGVTKPKPDAEVVAPWLRMVESMAGDLNQRTPSGAKAFVHHADARAAKLLLEPKSIAAVITSPPYPNEKDYTRTTRLESVLLGFLTDKASLRLLKSGMMRSNTRNVYKNDDDDQYVAAHPEVSRIAAAIEERRLELGKTSGFERMYHRVTKLYFGGMARHFEELQPALIPGAKLAYVVGDQASYLQVMIRTGTILADIAESLGYRVLGIDLFRTRLATATRQQLREEVVLLEWPGKPRRRAKAGVRKARMGVA